MVWHVLLSMLLLLHAVLNIGQAGALKAVHTLQYMATWYNEAVYLHRGMARQIPQQWKEPIPEKRRSEVDRRLDSLTNPKGSGALKDVQQNTVLRLLRLFNLCDLGTNSADKDKTQQALLPRRAARPRHVQNAVDHSEVWSRLNITTKI